MSKTYIPDTESVTNSKSKPEIEIALEICVQIRQKTQDSKSSKRDSTIARQSILNSFHISKRAQIDIFSGFK